MKAKELSNKTGLKERTIRFYEEQGLINPQMERRNGRYYREYSESDVKRLRAIATLRRAGFTVEEIRDMLEQECAVQDAFPIYLQRIQQAADTAVRLKNVAEHIRPQGMDIYALAEALEQGAKRINLPEADVLPHFGRFDTETEEEKKQAVACYRKARDRRRLSTVQWCVVALSVLCVALIVGCIGIFSYFHETPEEPEPSGSSEGWIYYKTYENGAYYLCRYDEQNGETQQIYESGEIRLAFLVTEKKLYVADGYEIYSLNADGTGKYPICKDVGAAKSGRMALHGGYLYVTTALPYNNAGQIARVDLESGELEELELGYLSDFEIWGDQLYTDYSGEIMITNLDTMDSAVYEVGTEPQSCIIAGGIVYELDDWSWIGTWSDDSEPGTVSVAAYGLGAEGQMERIYEAKLLRAEGEHCYVQNQILYYYEYSQGEAGSNKLRALDFSSGENQVVAEVDAASGYPNVYFGENGILVADSVDAPQYIPYNTVTG